MRMLFSSLLAAGLVTSQVAIAAQNCARPVEKTAFDVAGLKSQLIVTALTCGADQKYNAFVAKFRPDLLAEEKMINAYFVRVYGRKGTQQRDDYVTQLANSESNTGLHQGTLFCDRNLGTFDEVLALKTNAELPDYASAKSVEQPINFDACTTPERPSTARVHRVSASKAARHH